MPLRGRLRRASRTPSRTRMLSAVSPPCRPIGHTLPRPTGGVPVASRPQGQARAPRGLAWGRPGGPSAGPVGCAGGRPSPPVSSSERRVARGIGRTGPRVTTKLPVEVSQLRFEDRHVSRVRPFAALYELSIKRVAEIKVASGYALDRAEDRTRKYGRTLAQ